MNTTLNQIRKHNPCESSWKKLLTSLGKTQPDDEALPLRHILDTLGVEDAIWALRSLEGADKEMRLFACGCAERVIPAYEAKYPNDTRPRNAVAAARKYANGEATKEELDAAGAAARAAATDAAGAAARAAAWAAATDAAGAAAWAAAWAAAIAAARAAAIAAATDAAAWAAARAAAWAAARAAEVVEWDAQEEIFIKYFCS